MARTKRAARVDRSREREAAISMVSSLLSVRAWCGSVLFTVFYYTGEFGELAFEQLGSSFVEASRYANSLLYEASIASKTAFTPLHDVVVAAAGGANIELAPTPAGATPCDVDFDAVKDIVCAAGWEILEPASARRLSRADNAFLQVGAPPLRPGAPPAHALATDNCPDS